MQFYVLAAKNSKEDKKGESPAIYFEADGVKVLYGLGGNQSIFANAEKFGISLADVDVLVVPSGRDQTCGSLKKFLKINKKAKIYGRSGIWRPYYKKAILGKTPCGINKFEKLCAERFVPVDGSFALNTSVMLMVTKPLDGVFGDYFRQEQRKQEGKLITVEIEDDFSHELSVVAVGDHGTAILSTGSHSGLGGLLRGTALWKLEPVAMVLGDLSYFSKAAIGKLSALRRELNSTQNNQTLALYLDNIKEKTLKEIQTKYPKSNDLCVGNMYVV